MATNPDGFGMSELRPSGMEGFISPGATSMTNLVGGSPLPASRPGIKYSEIMPLLEAQDKKASIARRKKAFHLVLNLMKVPTLLLLLYIFICSLDFLSTSFRLIAGKAAGIYECLYFLKSGKESR
jgi:hypothetical protein